MLSTRSCWLFCIVLLFSTFAGARAQDVEYGLRAGGTLSNFHGSTEVITRGEMLESQRRGGFHVAGFVSLPLNEVLAVRPELMFIQKGGSVKGTLPFSTTPGDAPKIEEDYELSYLQLPLLLEARIPTSDSFQSYLLAGPSLGANLQANIERDEDALTEGIPESEIRTLEVGFIGGFELGYDVGESGTITVGTHYDLGLTQIVANDKAAARKGKEADFRNGALTVSLGYRFSL